MRRAIAYKLESHPVFASCLVPGSGEPQATWLDAEDGLWALRLQTADGPRLVVYSETGAGGECQGLRFCGALAVADVDAGVASLVGGDELQFGGVSLRAKGKCSLQARVADGVVTIRTGLQGPEELTVQGVWSVERQNADGTREPTRSEVGGAQTVFAAQARSAYRLLPGKPRVP